MRTYLFEELFFEDPYDPDNMLFQIPEEIRNILDLSEGDNVVITVTTDGFTLKKS
jgi:hypothetical protein